MKFYTSQDQEKNKLVERLRVAILGKVSLEKYGVNDEKRNAEFMYKNSEYYFILDEVSPREYLDLLTFPLQKIQTLLLKQIILNF